MRSWIPRLEAAASRRIAGSLGLGISNGWRPVDASAHTGWARSSADRHVAPLCELEESALGGVPGHFTMNARRGVHELRHVKSFRPVGCRHRRRRIEWSVGGGCGRSLVSRSTTRALGTFTQATGGA